MIIKKLKLKNIRSYKELELEFPKGSILLSGDIGSGKTSILLALQFALFGLQPGQKGNSILRQGEEEASVILEVEIDSDNIIIERSLKKAKNNSITQETNIITINNQRFELSTSEMKNRVITLLNYPKEFAKKSNLLYKFTVYTPQEEMKAIINERPEIRLDTLRHIFGIDRYKRIKENSQIFMQKVKETIRIKEAETSELNLLKQRFLQEQEKKIQISREVNNLSIECNNFSKEKQQSMKNLELLQKTIDEKRGFDTELGKAKVALLGKNDLESRFQKEIFIMQKQTSEKIDFSPNQLQNIMDITEKHKQNLEELNSKFIALNSRISILNSRKDEAFSMKDQIQSLDNCPTCFQTVSLEHKQKIEKNAQFSINEIDIELENKVAGRTQLTKDIEQIKHLIKGYEKDKEQLLQDKIKSEHQRQIETKIKSDVFILERASNEIRELQTKISELESRLISYKQAEANFESYKKEYDTIAQKEKQKEIMLAEKNKEIEILKKYLLELQEEILKKEKAKSEADYLRSLLDWMQEKFLFIITLTETKVLSKLRSEFSKIFSEWFSSLVSEDLSVRLDEDFTPIIKNQDYEIDYEFLSGGERTAVALAYRLALNQVLNSLLSHIKTKDLVILDEPTDGFSEEQITKMRDIFSQLHAEQTILVSHEQKIEGFVDHIIRIKKDGTSGLESVSS